MGAAVTSQGTVLPMKKIALAALLALIVWPALAQYDDNRRDGVFGPDSNQRPQLDSPKGRADAQQAPGVPGAPGGYGQPYYPKEPTSAIRVRTGILIRTPVRGCFATNGGPARARRPTHLFFVLQLPLSHQYRRRSPASYESAYMHDVRFGSKADIRSAKGDVRFTPNSGHVQCNSAMSALCQKRTHAPQQKTSLFDHLIGAGE